MISRNIERYLKRFRYTSLDSDYEYSIDNRDREFLVRESVDEDHPIISENTAYAISHGMELTDKYITVIRLNDGRKWVFDARCKNFPRGWANTDEYALHRLSLHEQAQTRTLPCAKEQPKSSSSSNNRGRAYALAALNCCAGELANAAPGTRNDKLNGIAYRLARLAARGWLDYDEIGAALWCAALANRSVADDGQRQFVATFNSGLKAGLKRPAPDPRERPSTINPQFFAGLKPRAA